MNDQLLNILKKAKLNFAILASILVLAIVGKLTNPEFTNSIFLVSELDSDFNRYMYTPLGRVAHPLGGFLAG